MAVTSKSGKKIDLVAIKTQLIKDRSDNKISEKDYRKSMKGLDTVTKAGQKGVNYQFTDNGRFKTSGSNGQSPSMNEAGVGISTRIPLFGKKVSKGLGYAQKVSNQQEAEAESKARKSIKPDVRLINPEISMDDIIAAQKKTNATTVSGTTSIPAPPLAITPEKETTAKKPVVMPDIKLINPDIPNFPNVSEKPNVSLTNPEIPNIKFEDPNIKLENPEITSEEIELKFKEKLDRIKKAIVSTGSGSKTANPVVYDSEAKLKKPQTGAGSNIIKSFLDSFGGGKNLSLEEISKRNAVKTKTYNEVQSKKNKDSHNAWIKSLTPDQLKSYQKQQAKRKEMFAQGGKIRKFGWGTNSAHSIQDSIGSTAKTASKKAQEEMLKKLMSKKTWLPKVTPNITLKNPEITAEDLKIAGDRRTLDSGIPPAVNVDTPKLDKSSLINTGIGLYSAASLLTAKKPTLRAPEDIKLNIRPAQGDEDMVSRSNNAIDESVRQGVGMLRDRTGSDLSSFVQGTAAMVDNAGKGRAGVLGQNAQMKRQDEVRMSNEINQGKQINHGQKDMHRRELNAIDQDTYNKRVAGAGNSLNQVGQNIVLAEGDDKRLANEREMANKRYNTQMVAYAKTLHDQGFSPAQIAAYLKSIKEVSYAKGGKLQTSERIVVNANRILGDANKELRKVIAEYSKLISSASNENIRQFNQNIRAISKRSTLTVINR